MSKLKEIFLYIAFALIVIPILFFSEILGCKALEQPDLSVIDSLDRNGGNSVAIIYDNNTWYAIFSPDSFYSTIESSLVSYFNRNLNYRTNYKGIENVTCINVSRYYYTSTNTTCSRIYRYNESTNEWVWQRTLANSNTYTINDVFNSYVYGFFNISYNGEIFWLNTKNNVNYVNRLFLPTYNISEYLGLSDYAPIILYYDTSRINNVLSSDDVTDSPTLSSSVLYNDVLTNYNSVVYNLSTINTRTITFDYDVSNITKGNYDIRFNITYKTIAPLNYDSESFYSLVYTFENNFGTNNVFNCQIIQNKVKKDSYIVNGVENVVFYYQVPYVCSGVNLAQGNTIHFLFNSPYARYTPEQTYYWYNVNQFLQTGSRNYFGLSNFSFTLTDDSASSLPVEYEQIDFGTIDENGNIILNNDNNLDVPKWFSSITNKINKNGTISSLILLPVTIYNKLIDAELNNTCSPINIGSLYGTTLYLPCVDVKQYLGNSLWSIIDVILCGCTLLGIRRTIISMYFDFVSLKFSERRHDLVC